MPSEETDAALRRSKKDAIFDDMPAKAEWQAKSVDDQVRKVKVAEPRRVRDGEEEAIFEEEAATEVVTNVTEVPEAHKKHMADSEKEKGNEAFYSKDFSEAEAYYSRSLQYQADDASAWANRALVRLKLSNFQGALEDCEHALALNGSHVKALHRKGKALYELQRFADAAGTFRSEVLELRPLIICLFRACLAQVSQSLQFRVLLRAFRCFIPTAWLDSQEASSSPQPIISGSELHADLALNVNVLDVQNGVGVLIGWRFNGAGHGNDETVPEGFVRIRFAAYELRQNPCLNVAARQVTFVPKEDVVLKEQRIGVRVRRGPDWKWGNQDGGAGNWGTTVVDSDPDMPLRWIKVQWDHGEKKSYRVGAEGKYDLIFAVEDGDVVEETEPELDQGHDEEWLSPDQAMEYECPVCKCVCRAAVFHDACTKLFCELCWNKVYGQKEECPVCRQSGEIQPSNRDRVKIMNLKIKCPNGCCATFPLVDKRSHLRICPHRKVRCQDCGGAIGLHLMPQHQIECEAKSLICKICGERVLAKQMHTHLEANAGMHISALLDKISEMEANSQKQTQALQERIEKLEEEVQELRAGRDMNPLTAPEVLDFT
ncbi:Spag1 [Symbiodinium sp. CCMP2456]|nr:Spag1 [Symbiodinium sp. CCMP2456]